MKTDKKVQGYMFKSLLKDPNGAGYFEYDDNSVAVTWNGFQLYILPKEEICFSLDKCKKISESDNLLTMTADDKELEFTNMLEQSGKKYYRKLKHGEIVIQVNDAYLKIFDKARFYARSQLERVLVTDMEKRVIGCVMPIKTIKGNVE